MIPQLLREYFTTKPDGIPGNDDTGTMSAWAVFSMMGFYPDCPGEPSYTLTAPTFEKVTITLNPKWYNGHNELVISKSGSNENGREAKRESYDRISDITLGRKTLKGYRISHEELTRGGELAFRCRAAK